MGASPTDAYRPNLPPIVDNLIHEKRVPAMTAVLVHNGGGDAQGSQRGLEYDTVSGLYATFIETEVTMAWFHPEWYRRVLSYSGTYVNQQSPFNPAVPRGAWEYHATLIPNSPRQPLRAEATANNATRD